MLKARESGNSCRIDLIIHLAHSLVLSGCSQDVKRIYCEAVFPISTILNKILLTLNVDAFLDVLLAMLSMRIHSLGSDILRPDAVCELNLGKDRNPSSSFVRMLAVPVAKSTRLSSFSVDADSLSFDRKAELSPPKKKTSQSQIRTFPK